MDATYLVHYGKKGMKWGKHTYRDDRGAPKPSHDEMRKVIQDHNLNTQYSKVMKKGPDHYEKAQLGLDIGNEGIKIGNTLNNLAKQNRKKQPVKAFDTSHMTDAQLQKKIQRLNMDAQYSRLMQEPETISRGQERLDKALSIGGATLATATSVLSIALMVKQLSGH